MNEKTLLIDREKESLSIIEKLRENREFLLAGTVLSFFPMKTEPDITPLFDERFLFPYIKDGEMLFANGPLEKGPMGFYEPVNKIAREYGKAVMLVPGRAFTRDGKRLGRGGGWYDRYIKRNREKLFTIGLSFREQIVDEIETEEHDEILDLVISAD